MTDEQLLLLNLDPEFHRWLDERDAECFAAMEQDGFSLDEEDDDGRYEQVRARWGHD